MNFEYIVAFFSVCLFGILLGRNIEISNDTAIIVVFIFFVFCLFFINYGKEKLTEVFDYKRKFGDAEIKYIGEDKCMKTIKVDKPHELLKKQLDTFDMFNNNSRHRFDSVDKANRERIYGDNKEFEGKTLWEIYDAGCTNDYEHLITKSKATPLFDDFEISRYPKFEKNKKAGKPDYGKWVGLELTPTDIIYKKPSSGSCYDKFIVDDEIDTRYEQIPHMDYSIILNGTK